MVLSDVRRYWVVVNYSVPNVISDFHLKFQVNLENHKSSYMNFSTDKIYNAMKTADWRSECTTNEHMSERNE